MILDVLLGIYNNMKIITVFFVWVVFYSKTLLKSGRL
jgi:hypothetical protein